MGLFSLRARSGRRWFVYDANKFPISFDICWALAWAELQCRKFNENSFNVVIINPAETFLHAKPESDPDYVSRDELMWRVQQVLIPLALMYKSVASVCSMSDDDQSLRRGASGVDSRHFLWPPPLQQMYREVLSGSAAPGGFSAKAGARRDVRNLLSAQSATKVISITIRESKGGRVRNSDIEEWNRFGETLLAKGFSPVFIPDTDRSFADLRVPARTLPMVALNMWLRVALYEISALNMFVSSGPAAICSLSPNIPYLVFKILADGERLSSREVVTDLGFRIGESPPFATKNQKWVWEDDTFDVLWREFCKLSLANRRC